MNKILSFAVMFGLFFAVLSGCATDGTNSEAGNYAATTAGSMAAESSTIAALMSKLNSDNALVRMGAVKAIGQLGGAGVQAVPALIPMLQSSDANVRANVAFTLGQIGPKANAAIPGLVSMISDKDSKAQRNAVEAIAKIGGANVPSLLVPLLIDINPTVQTSAMELLADFGPASKEAIPTLVSLAKGNKNLRDMAFDTLVKIGPDSVTAITALLANSDTDIVTKATQALSLLKK